MRGILLFPVRPVPSSAEGSHAVSISIGSADDPDTSIPYAFTMVTIPRSLQRIDPWPSIYRSKPITGRPFIITFARQTKPRSQQVTWSESKGCQVVLSRISPCICKHTTDAMGVPSAIACSAYRRAYRLATCSELNEASRPAGAFQSWSNALSLLMSPEWLYFTQRYV